MSEAKSAYAQAGVDIEAANRTKGKIKSLVQSTFNKGVLGDIGGFGGLFAPPWKQYKDPILVSSIDGVGTKLKLAFDTGIHNTIGRDIVFHCANDILVQGARPLFFTDYLALGSHDSAVVEAIISGLAGACREIDCVLLGGETAEMGDFYQAGEYDLAGSIVGMVERDRIIDGAGIRPGDVVIGLSSDGLHTNGFTLARRVVFEGAGLAVGALFPGSQHTVGEEMLRPHRSYVAPVLNLLDQVNIRGLAHITGGGIWDNIPRILPAGVDVVLQQGSWEIPSIFGYIQEVGGIEEREMYHVFNMGIGMVAVVTESDADKTVEILCQSGENAQVVGRVAPGEGIVRLSD